MWNNTCGIINNYEEVGTNNSKSKIVQIQIRAGWLRRNAALVHRDVYIAEMSRVLVVELDQRQTLK